MEVTNQTPAKLLLKLLEDTKFILYKCNKLLYYNSIMNNKHRTQMLYQKTDFNSSKICQLNGIFKCCKCKKNNSSIINPINVVQFCLFCGTPNYTKKII
jgi:hypothetical protein